MDKLVVLRTYFNQIEANIVKTKLESEGIFAVVEDGNILPYVSFFSMGKGGVKVKVIESQLERAKSILSEADGITP